MPLAFLTNYHLGLCQGRLTLNKEQRINVLEQNKTTTTWGGEGQGEMVTEL